MGLGKGNGRYTKAAKFEAQQKIARLLLAGNSQAECCRSTGIARKTIKSWIENEPEMRAMIEECRKEVYDRTVGEVMGMIPQALGIVKGALALGDVKVAMQLLTASGALQGAGRVLGVAKNDAASKAGEGLVIRVITDQDNTSNTVCKDAQATAVDVSITSD